MSAGLRAGRSPTSGGWKRSAAVALAATLLVIGALLVLIQVSPWYVGMNDDSGLFAYGGERILEGDLLYREIWDTKPPGVFYLNALALALGGHTPWAIWWFQLVWLSATAVLFLILLSRLGGILAGSLAGGLFLFTALYPEYFQGGNLTEVYALLPQVLALLAGAFYFRTGRLRWLLAVGLVTGAAFTLKPTYVALGAAVVGLAVARDFSGADRGRALRSLAAATVGFAVPVSAIVLYWGVSGALSELWGAVFRHNFGYVQEGLSLRSLYGTAREFLVNPPLVFLTALSIGGAARYWLDRPQSQGQAVGQMLPGFASRSASSDSHDWRRSVFGAAVLALPLEVAFVAVSGRNFAHYFLTPLPAMALAAAYLLQGLLPSQARTSRLQGWYAIAVSLAGALLIAWGLQVAPRVLPQQAHLADLFRRPLSGDYWTDELERYVVAHTSPSDPVLVWGYNPGLHFLTGRQAPSRYLFHAQLFTDTAVGAQRFDRFLDDLHANPPALILAQPESPHAIPFFGAEGAAFCAGCTPTARQQLAELRALAETSYELVREIDGWVIYRLRSSEA